MWTNVPEIFKLFLLKFENRYLVKFRHSSSARCFCLPINSIVDWLSRRGRGSEKERERKDRGNEKNVLCWKLLAALSHPDKFYMCSLFFLPRACLHVYHAAAGRNCVRTSEDIRDSPNFFFSFLFTLTFAFMLCDMCWVLFFICETFRRREEVGKGRTSTAYLHCRHSVYFNISHRLALSAAANEIFIVEHGRVCVGVDGAHGLQSLLQHGTALTMSSDFPVRELTRESKSEGKRWNYVQF